MKKNSFIAIVFMCLFVGFPVFSQEKGTSDIRLGYTVGSTTNDFLNVLEDFTKVMFEGMFGDVSSTEQETFNESFYVGYRYALQDQLMIGGALAYQKIMSKELNKENNNTLGELESNFYTIALDFDYHYVSTNFFQMYSGVGLAYTFNQNDFISKIPTIEGKNESDGYFNYQLDLVGFRVGKALAGFLELGFGYKGVANVGVSYQF